MASRILRLTLLFLLIIGFSAAESAAQVEISFPAISGSPGQTVTVPVTLSNVPASGFNSFQFDVTASSASVLFKGASKTGTIIPAGWSFIANYVANTPPDPNNRVLAFGSSQALITTDGVLAFLDFEIVAIEEGVTVELTDFRLKKGADNVAYTPAVPQTGLNASNSPVATDDSFTVAEGGTHTADAASGVLANDTDADGDPLTAAVGTGVSNGTLALAADGSFTYTHDGSETTSDSFTYSVSDGSTTDVGSVSITITPVNDPPQFTAEMQDQTVQQGAVVSGDYDATDPEGAAIAYSIVTAPAGASINAATGEFAYLANVEGVHSIVVQASDGSGGVQSGFTLTVENLEMYEGDLAGIHETTIVESAATGSVAANYSSTTKQLVVSGSFTGLSSLLVSAQVMSGNTTQDGDGLVSLTATVGGGGTSGTFETSNNTFDLNTHVFPAGWDVSMFETAIAAGEIYVNLRTVNVLTGEVRAQLRLTTNAAPAAVNIAGPSSSQVEGDPAATAYSLLWAPGTGDPESDPTLLTLDASSDILFGSFLSIQDVTSAAGSSVTVTIADAAVLYDQISGSTPGSVSIGGTATVYYRLRQTDGSSVSSGSPIGVVLTRGLVTDTEGDGSLPAEFALRGNYPNPFNPSTTIQFDLPEAAEVQVDVLDLLGRTMISIPVQSMSAGANNTVLVDASALSSGIYMYRVVARTSSQTYVATGTMTMIK